MLIWEFGCLGIVEWVLGDGIPGWNREWGPDIPSPAIFRIIGFHVTDAPFHHQFLLIRKKPASPCVSVNSLIVKEINGVELKALPLQSLLSGNYKWSRGTAVRIPLGVRADMWEAGKNDRVPMTWQRVWLMASHLFIAYRLRESLGAQGWSCFFSKQGLDSSRLRLGFGGISM